MNKKRLKLVVSEPTNGAAQDISYLEPYHASIKIVGTSDLLLHRWNCESVSYKALSAKGSKSKKTDDIESYVWRNDKKEICLPGEYLRQAIIQSAKYKQDPRSPRKSAADLFKASLVATTTLASLGCKEWDYLDTRRVTIQRAGINRTRPAMRAGWSAVFDFEILSPEYVSPDLLNDVVVNAGRLVGVGDFRPTFGRFSITNFRIKKF